MEGWKRTLILSVALVSYSLFFYYVYVTVDFEKWHELDFVGLFWFFVLLILMASFPIHIKGTSIVFLQAVTVAVFLQFGLIVEAVFSQLTLVYILFFRLKSMDWERYIINGTMFLLVSVGSASVFFALGGQIYQDTNGTPNIQIIPILGYIISNILINQICLKFIQNKLQNMKKEWLDKDFWWEVIPVSIILPTGLLIYVLYSQLGSMAILYVMIPIVTFSIIIKLYNRLETMNEKLKAINHTGNIMTGKLAVDHVIHEFLQAIEKLVPYKYLYLFRVDDEQKLMIPIEVYGTGIPAEQRDQFLANRIEIGDGLSGRVAALGKSVMIGHKRDDINFKNEPDFLKHQNSILSVPLIRSNQVIGVVTLSHQEPNQYAKEDSTLVEILANQAAIALKNADKYEQTKRQSEIDELTGLYNYRYFEHILFERVAEVREKQQQLALVILDIDYFKRINDQYGHLAGNTILQKLAEILVSEVQEDGIVTRYGGEEFTILYPCTDKEQGYQSAEKIRKRIESTSIEVSQDLAHGDLRDKVKHVQITVSMGIAIFPEHAEDPLSLVRHADRAMYMGAKREGRNKVAVYQAGNKR